MKERSYHCLCLFLVKYCEDEVHTAEVSPEGLSTVRASPWKPLPPHLSLQNRLRDPEINPSFLLILQYKSQRLEDKKISSENCF